MATATAARRPGERVGNPASGRGATHVAVGVFGTLVGLAGVEHGVGEILQGPVRTDGPFILSWPDAPALEVLSGEPAMTVISNLLVTGILAVAVGLAVVIWSVRFAGRPHGGLVLIGLSVLLLLVGGGLAPPVMGVAVGAVATRVGAAPGRPLGGFVRNIGSLWPWFLAFAVLGYLGLMPGMVLASVWGVASETLVIGLAVFAFTNLALALTAAWAHDRVQASMSAKRKRIP